MSTYYEAATPVGDGGLANAAAEPNPGPAYYERATTEAQSATDSDNTTLLWYVLAFALGFTAAKVIK